MPGTREQLRQATQRRVLHQTARLFRERGFASTTVRDIADAAGVSLGTVMAAGDKNGLLVRVFDDLIRGEQRPPGRTPDVPPSGTGAPSVTERLLDLVRPFVALFAAHQDLARTYASILVSGQHTSVLFSELSSGLIDQFREALTQTGDATPAAAPAKAEALYYAYVGTLFTWAARPDGPAELLESLRRTFAAICPAEVSR